MYHIYRFASVVVDDMHVAEWLLFAPIVLISSSHIALFIIDYVTGHIVRFIILNENNKLKVTLILILVIANLTTIRTLQRINYVL